MPPKKNPLKLNPLQLKTLALFQELARYPETSSKVEETGEVVITNIPHPHGDHFHIGAHMCAARDASGLHNPSVWVALMRKGLAKGDFPLAIMLTKEGLAYDTGMAHAILHGGHDHDHDHDEHEHE
jgi:hypothetical protein